MKTALITTTINVPAVLSLYRRFDPAGHVKFFVASDHKTPVVDTYNLCTNLGNCELLTVERQNTLNYKCSELIGWNTISRRNIALLEALKWGADLIISVDDDNIPMDPNYFYCFGSLLTHQGEELLDRQARPRATRPYPVWRSGLQAMASTTGWLDPGQLLIPPTPQRGFPIDPAFAGRAAFTSVVDAKVGLAQGMILGDPDCSAVTRIANRPSVHAVSEVLKSGFVVDPKDTWTITNSQNTAFVRELAPAFFMLPGVGRYDDIFASLIMQRLMREKGYVTHFGRPFAFQERNKHNLVNDLKGELLGMERVVHFAGVLDHMGQFPVDQHPVETIWDKLAKLDWIPEQTSSAAYAFLADCEAVL